MGESMIKTAGLEDMEENMSSSDASGRHEERVQSVPESVLKCPEQILHAVTS